MSYLGLPCLLLGFTVVSTKTRVHCNEGDIQMVARVVFGEAWGESAAGKLAVAYTIVNRVKHQGYPSSLHGVVYATYTCGSSQCYEYNTLDEAGHTTAWNDAKNGNTATYRSAITATRGALCKEQHDPTHCGATDFCARDPCSATDDNQYWMACDKIQIGNHYFVCRKHRC